ncbi:MAG: tetratricopeptide repeat protein [Methanobrevibacter sp.]|uniref:tetratricopeptide repeat protein n=1 Tax=Methanobrevibacter sp. TaxID=66852 RepID=UPI003F08683E
MTTDNHLNSFAELDCETTENHSKTAEELLNVENLNFDNTRYLAEILFKLKRYDESIKQLKRALSLSHDDELLTLIGITYFKMGEYETAISIDSRNLNFYLEYISLLMIDGEVEKAKKMYNRTLLYFPLFDKSFDEIEATYQNMII